VHRLLRGQGGAAIAGAGRYFRLMLVGYLEGIDSERGMAWRTADSPALRQFLGLGWSAASLTVTTPAVCDAHICAAT
jgi:hypothetical protein